MLRGRSAHLPRSGALRGIPLTIAPTSSLGSKSEPTGIAPALIAIASDCPLTATVPPSCACSCPWRTIFGLFAGRDRRCRSSPGHPPTGVQDTPTLAAYSLKSGLFESAVLWFVEQGANRSARTRRRWESSHRVAPGRRVASKLSEIGDCFNPIPASSGGSAASSGSLPKTAIRCSACVPEPTPRRSRSAVRCARGGARRRAASPQRRDAGSHLHEVRSRTDDVEEPHLPGLRAERPHVNACGDAGYDRARLRRRRVTTAPAPTSAPAPMRTPPRTSAPEPMLARPFDEDRQQLPVLGSLRARRRPSWRADVLSFTNVTPWPTNTSSSMSTPEQMNV